MKRDFWNGFGCGAASVVAGALLAARLKRGGASRILRLEKSIQIASPLERVFDTWSDLDTLARMSPSILNVRTYRDRSRWTVNVNGVPVEWVAQITQVMPYEAIGWKSVTGPKHSGRITFGRIGQDTLVHVQMNYRPPMRLLRPMLSPFSGDLEGCIERTLREFKAAMESQPRTQTRTEPARATGTYGPGPELLSDKQNAKYGSPSTPVEYTAPPEAKR